MYLFEHDDILKLLNQPEYGMGYQRIQARLTNGNSPTGYVFNAELFVPDEDRILHKLVERRMVFANALKMAEWASPSISSFDVIPRYVTDSSFDRKIILKNTLQESKGAAEGPAETTDANEAFKRFTAYENDRRITASGGLLSGSYATTEADAHNVSNGRQAVARYALPNPEPAIYVFTIKPSSGTTIQRGTVQPAYGQPGGGAEVIFPRGTTNKTVTGPGVIPEG